MPAPLRVTRPPPSSTTLAELLRTFAVAASEIVTGSGPHEKVITPPAATAATTAAEVQLAALPSPITLVGRAVSTAAASAGTTARPAGLPIGATGAGCLAGWLDVAGAEVGAGDAAGRPDDDVAATGTATDGPNAVPAVDVPQPASSPASGPASRAAVSRVTPGRMARP
ncbi:MAG: hypothetical protein ACJ72N_20145 [Labedaea sp.]